ncbi:Peptidyl-Lys metalloendopeptidase OS=Grifola frondosa GN=MEP PE=1 SV=2 [Rhizoctonia solani AG-1 IB]|uniref:Peptidyl-Lys metalloendopeptidase n=1 Tax=Thanatephorus cucumeris (strain AG1-IB / isolate 7/3/14) TaxID=1108050 RepID=A0A0B7FWC2_THACB|nr:Peptidyl-Lys metalloendopeptidase OS=Grifola frondosa GN=MEP PE=1 SV=2 [Rhizoctonia solani AG-1 IB]
MISTTSFGLALVSLWSAGVVSAAPGLTLSTFGPASVSDVSALKITTSIKNTGTETLRLLNDPNSVLSTWETDSFNIARAESNLVASPALNFTGLRVKYSPEAAAKLNKPELFTIIPAGATVNITHNLASTYDFSGKGGGAGKYKLKSSQRARTFLSVGADGKITSLEATEDKVAEVSVSGRLSGPKLQPGAKGAAHASGSFQQASGVSKRALVRGCNNDQINQILTAADRANNMAHGAHGFLRDGPWATRRWQEWFGGWDQNRYNLVWGHYDKIRFNPPNFLYDCTCTDDGIYAYVLIPGHFQEVYLCGAFWRAPMEGTDSKAGTIVHEASHFPEYAGTADHAYGQGACRDLARNDPNRAAMNADSHEYFAENQPWLGQ